MARFEVHLDHAAIARMLKVQFAPAVNEKAEAVAASARAAIVEPEIRDAVEVSTYTTDRARPSVCIAHPAGKGIEVRDGVLTKAAAEHGLEVRAKRE